MLNDLLNKTHSRLTQSLYRVFSELLAVFCFVGIFFHLLHILIIKK